MDERIIELGNEVKGHNMTWQQAADTFNAEFGENLSPTAIRKRYAVRVKNSFDDVNVNSSETKIEDGKEEFETVYHNGMIEAQKIVEYNKEVFGDKRKMLEYLGYNPDEWEFVYLTTSTWGQHTKTQETKQLYAVKFKLKPLINNLSMDEALECAKKVFREGIVPFEFESPEYKELNEDRLMEIPAIELHLGKYAEYDEVGQDYSTEIGKERFYKILREILKIQDKEKCDRCLVMIGNDFFNSDTVGNTTTKGTPQTNDIRWKSLFVSGLELYKDFFFTLREEFNHIDVRLCQGNHDTMSSFYLYMTLSAFFAGDEKIEFSDNYRQYQCYSFGDNAIFFGHGDCNLKRLVSSIPGEFYEEWGRSVNRELHLGHLHSEMSVDEASGMITRRIGSPTGTDAWHYGERFVGSMQKHQVFIWDKYDGLKGINYIGFSGKEKKLKKKREKVLTK